MDFSNKILPNILKTVLWSIVAIAAVCLLFKVIPVILTAAIVIWAVYKIVKLTNEKGRSHINASVKNSKDDFSCEKDKAIDVDYKDVK